MKTTDKFPEGTILRANMSTKESEDSSTPVKHTVVVDFEGATVSHVMGIAMRQIKVLVAGKVRKDLPSYPPGDLKVKVTDCGQGGSLAVITLEGARAFIAKMSPEKRAEFLASLPR